ncbi:hypothetical protein HK104_002564 [Borealophlyctis nickersoniae]|nr:hypothetical protein HK104_002564 [Borealophlyctis nickersoniae]
MERKKLRGRLSGKGNAVDAGEGGKLRTWWVKLVVWELERAGPFFIKLGQWASSRVDILPHEVCDVLARLQARVRPHSFAATRTAVEEMLEGRKLEEVFEEFDVEPVGVGAVAQRPGSVGVECAVKVLHPGVEKRIADDLAVVTFFGGLVSLLKQARYLSVSEELSTFASMMQKQTDMTIEADNLDRFIANFQGTDEKGRRRGKHVLVETFHRGLPMRMFLDKGPTVYDKRFANVGVRAFMQMVMQDNFCHADLHPGNILITLSRKPDPPSSWLPSLTKRSSSTATTTNDLQLIDDATMDNLRRAPRDAWNPILERLSKDGYQPTLVVLDAGLVSSLSPEGLENLQASFKAGLEFDGEKIATLLMDRCLDPSAVVDRPGAKTVLKSIMDDVKMDDGGRLPISKVHTMKIVQRCADLLRVHRIQLQGEFVGLFVSAVLVEGVGRKLNADLDLVEVLADYLG